MGVATRKHGRVDTWSSREISSCSDMGSIGAPQARCRCSDVETWMYGAPELCGMLQASRSENMVVSSDGGMKV